MSTKVTTAQVAYAIAAVLDGDYDDGLDVYWDVSTDGNIGHVTITHTDDNSTTQFFLYQVEEVGG